MLDSLVGVVHFLVCCGHEECPVCQKILRVVDIYVPSENKKLHYQNHPDRPRNDLRMEAIAGIS
jgi:hypothetical protein